MIVTEEEAKTKQCCGGRGCGRTETGSDGRIWSRCIGSACMAWRWQDNLSPEHQRGDGGYCGKAGKP